MSAIVNVKVKFIRPKYDNLREWMKDNNNVYIGRGGIVFIDNERFPKNDSVWANPYKIGKDGSREEVIERYKKYIIEKIKNGECDLTELHGKNLGCWCAPEECHGNVLIQLINQ